MKPNYKRMAGKWMHIHYAEQETIAELNKRIKYLSDDVSRLTKNVENNKQEVVIWKTKYAEILTENIRLLEKIKALTGVER